MIKNKKWIIADIEKVWVVWIEDETSYNIPLSQRLIQGNALIFFHSVMAEVRKLQKKALKLAETGLWSLRKASTSIS